MIVRNNQYWVRLARMGKRTPRKRVSTSGPVNFDWSACKTLRVEFVRYKPGEKTRARRIKQGRSPSAKVDGQLLCLISPGRY
jgi:hypothetical protein